MMKRPLLHASIAFGTGILTAWYIRQVFFIMVIFLLAMLLYGYIVRKKIPLKCILLWAICFLSGYMNLAFQYTVLLEPIDPIADEQVSVTGYISGACTVTDGKAAFDFYAETLESGEHSERLHRRIRINVYGADGESDFSAGTRLVIRGVLEKPSPSRNPGGFDYQQYLLSAKLPAMMTVKINEVIWTGPAKALPLMRFGLKTRDDILSSLKRNLSEEKAALMAAMLTGYREDLTSSMENAFSAAGLTHIMAVSGANLGILLLPLIWLFKMLGLDRRVAAICTMPFIIFFILITGMEASVLRASVMAFVILVGKVLDRKADLINSLGIASLAILVVNPFMLFHAGFLLSFGATAGLGLLYARVHRLIPEWLPVFIREALAATISAQAGVLPLLILFFNKISLISLLSNLLVVPLTGITSIIGMISVIADSFYAPLGTLTGYLLQGLLHIILFITDACASIPWAQVNVQHWSLTAIVVYYALLIPAGAYGLPFFIRYKKAVAACALLVGIILIVQGMLPGRLKVTFVDVGQGDSALISTAEGRNYLIDGGGKYREEETGYTGQRILLPLLMHEGITELDQVLVSHAHSDHLSGVLTLLQDYPVKSVGLPEYPGSEQDFAALIKICVERGITVQYLSMGDELKLDSKTTLRILHPNGSTAPADGNLNNTSLCCLLQYDRFRVLFTGDLETDEEIAFLANNGPVDCDVLKVAHHGGKDATSNRFLQAVTPETAIISVGKNSYGHPSPEVLERLDGIRAFITLHAGAVIADSDGKSYRIRSWCRDQRFTFWD